MLFQEEEEMKAKKWDGTGIWSMAKRYKRRAKMVVTRASQAVRLQMGC